MAQRDHAYLTSVVRNLSGRPRESECLEFKENLSDPDEIGEYISALSNTAALRGELRGWVIWGMSGVDRRIVGTTFQPHAMKVGNEELENWLLHLLTPQVAFTFTELSADNGLRLVLLEITPAASVPVRFKGLEYIRVGSYKKKLKDHPELERQLWRVFDEVAFESGIALDSN